MLALKQNSEIPNLWKAFDGQRRKAQVVWILVFSVCTLIFVYEAVNRLDMLVRPPKSAFVKLLLAEKLAFPSVTVCPGYQFRRSTAKEFTRIDKFGCQKSVPSCNWNFPWNMLTHTENIFKKCRFKREKNCLPGLEEKGKWRRVLTSLGRCFTYDSSEFVNCGGDLSSLEFTVDPMIWDRSEILLFSGIRVYIHDDDEVPLAEINGINVNEGASAAFSLRVKRYSWVRDERRNPCVEVGQRSNYTKSKCVIKCIHEAALKSAMVNCKAPFMTSLTQKICKTRKEIASLSTEFNLIVNNGTYWNVCTKSCPELCEKMTYTPITASLGFTKQDGEESSSTSSLITIKIYFGDMWLETITETWAYNLDEFIADTGGSLNLFLGASFITIIQLFDLLMLKAWRLLGRWKNWYYRKLDDRFLQKQAKNLTW